MKRPAFQFYPADWQKDAALQSCSIGARGLWIEMLCIMHQCEPYGHLAVNCKPMTAGQLARLVGETLAFTKRALAELDEAGVFSRGGDGCVYSRRMVKDEHVRNVRSDAGKLGGNPNLLAGKDKQTVNHASNLEPTPSSSSSSSTSNLTPLAPSDESLDANAPVKARKNGVHKQFADGAVVIAIPLIGEAEYEVHQSLVEELERLYPAVDIPQTLREIRGWNLSRPRERKTESGVLAHINTWLKKEQNRG